MKNNGFALIELLVVVSIIMIFTGLSIPAYTTFTQTKKLESDAQKLIDTFDLAKQRASSGDVTGISCADFTGYQVRLGASSYELNTCCSVSCATKINRLTNSFSSDISLVGVSITDINFRPLGMGSDLGADYTIYVKNTSTKRCIPITISRLGLVTQGDAENTCSH